MQVFWRNWDSDGESWEDVPTVCWQWELQPDQEWELQVPKLGWLYVLWFFHKIRMMIWRYRSIVRRLHRIKKQKPYFEGTTRAWFYSSYQGVELKGVVGIAGLLAFRESNFSEKQNCGRYHLRFIYRVVMDKSLKFMGQRNAILLS